MKGSPMQRNFGIGSPIKGAGFMTIARDRDTKALDAYRSDATIEKRHKKNTLERGKFERLLAEGDASIAQEKATQRRHQSAHRDPFTGAWKA